MDESNNKLFEFINEFKNRTLPNLPDYSNYYDNLNSATKKVVIDEKDTFDYQIQQQTNQIVEKSEKQISLLAEQNEQLANNYEQLENLYKLKEKELSEAKTSLKISIIFNIIMFVVSVASVLVSLLSWLFPNILGGAS